VYAVGMLRGRRDRYHRLGFLIPFTVAAIATPVQMFVGDQVMRGVMDDQPVKFAAIELVPETDTDVPETLFGRLDGDDVEGGIPIPGLASFLSGFSTDTEIQGLNTVAPEDRPPATIVHWAFDIMVFTGSFLALVSVWFLFVWWRRRDLPRPRWFLRVAAVCGVLAMITMEAGWVTTEVGRQPWVVYGVLRTEDAVTDADGVWISLGVIVVVYAAIAVATVMLLRRMAARWRDEHTPVSGGPYAPAGPLVLPTGPKQPVPPR
jgi:cytochrome d ubiquinol oxidase subunit I